MTKKETFTYSFCVTSNGLLEGNNHYEKIIILYLEYILKHAMLTLLV